MHKRRGATRYNFGAVAEVIDIDHSPSAGLTRKRTRTVASRMKYKYVISKNECVVGQGSIMLFLTAKRTNSLTECTSSLRIILEGCVSAVLTLMQRPNTSFFLRENFCERPFNVQSAIIVVNVAVLLEPIHEKVHP